MAPQGLRTVKFALGAAKTKVLEVKETLTETTKIRISSIARSTASFANIQQTILNTTGSGKKQKIVVTKKRRTDLSKRNFLGINYGPKKAANLSKAKGRNLPSSNASASTSSSVASKASISSAIPPTSTIASGSTPPASIAEKPKKAINPTARPTSTPPSSLPPTEAGRAPLPSTMVPSQKYFVGVQKRKRDVSDISEEPSNKNRAASIINDKKSIKGGRAPTPSIPTKKLATTTPASRSYCPVDVKPRAPVGNKVFKGEQSANGSGRWLLGRKGREEKRRAEEATALESHKRKMGIEDSEDVVKRMKFWHEGDDEVDEKSNSLQKRKRDGNDDEESDEPIFKRSKATIPKVTSSNITNNTKKNRHPKSRATIAREQAMKAADTESSDESSVISDDESVEEDSDAEGDAFIAKFLVEHPLSSFTPEFSTYNQQMKSPAESGMPAGISTTHTRTEAIPNIEKIASYCDSFSDLPDNVHEKIFDYLKNDAAASVCLGLTSTKMYELHKQTHGLGVKIEEKTRSYCKAHQKKWDVATGKYEEEQAIKKAASDAKKLAEKEQLEKWRAENPGMQPKKVTKTQEGMDNLDPLIPRPFDPKKEEPCECHELLHVLVRGFFPPNTEYDFRFKKYLEAGRGDELWCHKRALEVNLSNMVGKYLKDPDLPAEVRRAMSKSPSVMELEEIFKKQIVYHKMLKVEKRERLMKEQAEKELVEKNAAAEV